MIEEFLTIIGVILLGVNHGIMQAYLNTLDKASSIPDEIINFGIPTTINIFVILFLTWGIIYSRKTFTRKLIIIFFLVALSSLELYYVYAKTGKSPILGQVLLYSSTIFKLYVLITLHCDVSALNSRSFISSSLEKAGNKLKSFSETIRKIPTEPTYSEKPKPPKEPKEPKPEPEDKEVEPDIIKASQIFNDALTKTQLIPTEIEQIKSKFNDGLTEDKPWNTLWNTFNNSVVGKIPTDTMTREQKDELRNKFRTAMGKTPK